MENQMTPPPQPSAPPVVSEDKTAAILSYITLLGFFVAIFIHNSKKTKLGAFHLRQMLGFLVTAIIVGVSQIILVFIPILGWLAIFVLWISMLVLWIMGLISALSGQMKPMPIMGAHYQKWFANTFE